MSPLSLLPSFGATRNPIPASLASSLEQGGNGFTELRKLSFKIYYD